MAVLDLADSHDIPAPTIILKGTNTPLRNDERAVSLVENDAILPNGKAWHRLQTVRVIRDGELYEFVRDMGPSANYAAAPLCIVTLETDSVGEVLDQANRLREDKGLEQAMADHLGEVNVVELALLRAEQMQEFLRRNRRSFPHQPKRKKYR